MLSRFLVAMTLFATALLFASSGASAHAGRSHAVVQPPAAYHFAAEHSDRGQDAGEAQAQIRDEAAPSADMPWSKSIPSCAGGCCHAPGKGCCAAWVCPTPAIAAPIHRHPTIIAAVSRGVGVTPGVLPEPPNFLP